MSVRAGSPGGSRFPKRHFLRARNEAPAFLDSLEDAPAVFFFDDPAAGNRLIAKELSARGSLVYFEPSKVVTNADLEAVAISDIIKFSDENVPVVSFVDAYKDKVFIQSMGAKGARFKFKGEPWVMIEDATNESVIDTEGAGDWLSSEFINAIIGAGIDFTCEDVRNALLTAMGWAGVSVRYMGSKGLIREG